MHLKPSDVEVGEQGWLTQMGQDMRVEGEKMKLRIKGITKGWGKHICNMVEELG